MQSHTIIHLIEGNEGYGVATILRQISRNMPSTRFMALAPGRMVDQIPATQLLWVGDKDLNIKIGQSTLRGFASIILNVLRWWGIAKNVGEQLPPGPVLFHCLHLFLTLIAVLVKLQRPKLNIKIIYHFESLMNRKRLFGLLPKLQRVIIGNSVDGIIACSDAVADYWRPVRCPLWVVYNGMEQKQSAQMHSELLNYQDKKNIVIAASLSHEKGQMVAVEAMKLLGERVGEFHLWIAGGPIAESLNPFAGELKNAIRRNGLGEYVTLLGLVENINSIAPFAWAALQQRITPEPFGIWTVEAMSAGLPVIASNGGGTSEIITHEKDGLLVPSNDQRAVADAILRLADDDSLHARLASAAALRARDFTAEAFIAKLIDVYVVLGVIDRNEAYAR